MSGGVGDDETTNSKNFLLSDFSKMASISKDEGELLKILHQICVKVKAEMKCVRCSTTHCDEDDEFETRELFESHLDGNDICRKCIREEDEAEDDWMEIYSQHETFKAFCGDHEHLKPYHDFRYFQCWGGGDEGGFIMNDKDETYKVNRGWFQPFTVEPVDGILDIGHRHGVEQLRVIPKPCEIECVGAEGAPPCNAIVKGGDTICDECFKYVKA